MERSHHSTTLATTLEATGYEATTVEAMNRRIQALESAVEELTLANGKLRALALADDLTGLANRRAFMERMTQALSFASRHGGYASLLLVDLDDMKYLNDTYGHQVGDLALQAVGDVFRASLRTSDVAARLGGDEFAVLLPHTDSEGAEVVAERIRRRIAQFPLAQGARMTVSIGVASIDADGGAASAPMLIDAADRALYDAKRTGRNRTSGRNRMDAEGSGARDAA